MPRDETKKPPANVSTFEGNFFKFALVLYAILLYYLYIYWYQPSQGGSGTPEV